MIFNFFNKPNQYMLVWALSFILQYLGALDEELSDNLPLKLKVCKIYSEK